MTRESGYFEQGGIFHGNVPLVMGTKLDLIAAGVPQETAECLWNRMCDEAARLESLLNRFDPSSEVGRANASLPASFETSPELAGLIESARRYKELTDGLFDIAGGRLGEVRLNGLTLAGERPGLDFGGYAKGYFLKVFKSALIESGIQSAFVNFGNSTILATGSHPYGDCWKVSVTDPYSGLPLKEFDLKNETLSTSGNTPAYSGHIIDPRCGRKVEGRKVAVALSPDPLDAEVLSTVAMIATEEEMKKILRNFPEARTESYKLN